MPNICKMAHIIIEDKIYKISNSQLRLLLVMRDELQRTFHYKTQHEIQEKIFQHLTNNVTLYTFVGKVDYDFKF